MLLLKAVFLYLTIFMTMVNAGRAIYRNDIPIGNIILHAIGITGLIVVFFLL